MAGENEAGFEKEIAALAHSYWEEEGCPENQSVQHWERAEREIRRRFGEGPADGQWAGGIANDTGASGKMG